MLAKAARALEFGDYQTPPGLAREMVERLRRFDPSFDPRTIIEPTCGVGAFLFAAADAYPRAERVVGIEIDKEYHGVVEVEASNRGDFQRFDLLNVDFLRSDWRSRLEVLPRPFLVIGNPPWVTSSEIGRMRGSNLPRKANFKKYSGLEALTGRSNFDLSETVLEQGLEWIRDHGGCLAMLCKTSVARKLLLHARDEGILVSDARMILIDAKKYFSASVDACLFLLRTNGGKATSRCGIYERMDAERPSRVLGHHEGIALSNTKDFRKYRKFLGRDERYSWRSGIKHDCSRVMELSKTEDGLRNGFGESVAIEDHCLHPLLKSRDLSNGRVKAARLKAIVTQRKIGQPTSHLREEAPRTWKYLSAHAAALDGRKSSVYRNKPRFSIFGVGDYTFSDWKVAIPGFGKSLNFQVVGSLEGKPVVFDDTIYFLAARTRSEAMLLESLLNSEPCRRFLGSMIFWSDKRPITGEILKRLDIRSLAEHLGREREYSELEESAGQRQLDWSAAHVHP